MAGPVSAHTWIVAAAYLAAGIISALALRVLFTRVVVWTIGGLVLLTSRKVQPGDFIQLDNGMEGYVEDTNWRNTILRQLPNNLLVVPNATVASSIVTNYHLPEHELSVTISCGVSYESDLERVERVTVEVGQEVMHEVKGGVPEHEPTVRYNTFGDSSICFNVGLREGIDNSSPTETVVRQAPEPLALLGVIERQARKIGHAMDISRFAGHDGAQLAYRETGSGRPLILLHGFMGTGSHWLDQGPADTLTEQGFYLVLPDLRGHGESTRSHDPLAYPPDVLADDGLALIEHLGLGAGEYDLGGYSLGGRIVVRMLARGAEPGRAFVAGQGLAKVSGSQGGGATHRTLTALVDGVALDPGSPGARTAHWAARTGADPRALLNVMGSLVPTPEDDLRRITTPTLVVIGDRDERSDADELAALLPAGCFIRVPGGHVDAFAAPEFAAAIKAFLTDRTDQPGEH
jgi:pimeloyl-ACP methyl ester carboxylesterase